MAGPSSVLARKREATCNAILDATGELIAERGVDGFPISEVAKRGRVNRALIYHYFKNRENLIVQAINRIVERYEAIQPESANRPIEHSVRLHIEHPELARLFFHMLLNGRPLSLIGERIAGAIDALRRFQQERAPQSTVDPTFLVTIIVLAGLSWSLFREEMARLLDISVEEADERFIAQLRRAGGLSMQPATGFPNQNER